MKFIETLNDYRLAISSARKGLRKELLPATLGVLRSRIRDGIGPQFHSLYDFRNKPETEWDGYMAENDGVRILERMSPQGAHQFLRDKLKFALHCVRQGFPIAPTLFRYDQDRFPEYDEVAPNVQSRDEWNAALAKAPDQLFCKLIDGRLGIGAFKAERRENEWFFGGERGSADDLRSFALKRLGKGRGWLFQPAIRPHPDLAEIMSPGALGTLRAISYIDVDGVHVVFPLLRIPAGGNIVDNFSRGAKGNLVAAIDKNTGRLSAAQYSRSTTWPDIASIDHHPDTGKIIHDREVPWWAEAKALMLAAQAATPEPPTIGWDIAITAAGPQIIEANSQYSTSICQVAYNRGIKKDFEQIIESINKHRAENTRRSSALHPAPRNT